MKRGHLLFGMHKTFHKHEKAMVIGLYITQIQIESMNGTVTVESELEREQHLKSVLMIRSFII